MLAEANEIPSGSTLNADVCIVGAGAAGITLAKEFVSKNLHVILLESGGFVYDAKAQSLNRGKSLGIPYGTDTSRMRMFGGTTIHWGGSILPLNETDFLERPWLPYSGWPFGLEDLVPYYKRAEKVLQVEGQISYEPWDPARKFHVSFLGPNVRQVGGAKNPLRFGFEYRDELAKSPNISCYIFATVLDIQTTETGSEVSSLLVRGLEGGSFSVKARQYVLATGGLENARLLLLSNKQRPAGIGNDHDHVGRYFQEHVGFWHCARVVFNDQQLTQQIEKPVWFSFAEEFLSKQQIMSGNIGLLPKKTPELSNFDKVYGRFNRWISNQEPRPMSAKYWAEKGIRPFDLTIDAEQAPNPSSRVTLDAESDIFGQQKLALNWDLSDFDRNNIRRNLELLGGEIGRQDIGKLWIRPRILNEWPFRTISYGFHHCGTTRMSVQPETGVVDPDCRVHGVHNLFIAGSSVFPTAGRANPTFTIVALAIRLADKIKENLG